MTNRVRSIIRLDNNDSVIHVTRRDINNSLEDGKLEIQQIISKAK